MCTTKQNRAAIKPVTQSGTAASPSNNEKTKLQQPTYQNKHSNRFKQLAVSAFSSAAKKRTPSISFLPLTSTLSIIMHVHATRVIGNETAADAHNSKHTLFQKQKEKKKRQWPYGSTETAF